MGNYSRVWKWCFLTNLTNFSRGRHSKSHMIHSNVILRGLLKLIFNIFFSSRKDLRGLQPCNRFICQRTFVGFFSLINYDQIFFNSNKLKVYLISLIWGFPFLSFCQFFKFYMFFQMFLKVKGGVAKMAKMTK